jgi:pimeloyl-ACP methyl ester carboxylesterase
MGYYDHPTTNYPAMMYVHGGGETVTDASNAESNFSKMNQTPFSALIAAGQNYPGLVVQPQCNNGVFDCVNVGSTDYLAEVVDQVNATYRTNAKKFSVIGMSWGGAGALDFAYDYPAKISAVAGVAGGIFYRSVAAGTLCAKYATNKLALWGVNNTYDPWYSKAQVNSGGGAYVGDVVNTIAANCTGYPDARFTEYSDNTTFPVNFHAHEYFEFTLGNSPFYDYANCTGGNGFKSWNGTTCVADTNPTTFRVPMHPVMTAALAAASTALTGSATTFSSITDWLFYFEKP